MKHKHCDLIVAWANGAEIQCKQHDDNWVNVPYPYWVECTKYRIKPQPKPDVTRYFAAHRHLGWATEQEIRDNYETDVNFVKVVFDGETCMLKSMEKV